MRSKTWQSYCLPALPVSIRTSLHLRAEILIYPCSAGRPKTTRTNIVISAPASDRLHTGASLRTSRQVVMHSRTVFCSSALIMRFLTDTPVCLLSGRSRESSAFLNVAEWGGSEAHFRGACQSLEMHGCDRSTLFRRSGLVFFTVFGE